MASQASSLVITRAPKLVPLHEIAWHELWSSGQVARGRQRVCLE